MFGGVDLESKTWGDYAFAFRDDNILSSEARGYGKIVLLYVRKSWDEYRAVFKQAG